MQEKLQIDYPYLVALLPMRRLQAATSCTSPSTAILFWQIFPELYLTRTSGKNNPWSYIPVYKGKAKNTAIKGASLMSYSQVPIAKIIHKRWINRKLYQFKSSTNIISTSKNRIQNASMP
jgi:hypothetical protein